MSDEANPLFLISGRVYTNEGELRPERVTTVLRYNDYLAALTDLYHSHGYLYVNLGDSSIKIKVDLIEEVVDE